MIAQIIILIFAFVMVIYMNNTIYIGGGEHNGLTLHIREPWFSYIVSGEKTIESRAGPKRRFENWKGKELIFHCNGRSHTVKVIDVVHYADLVEYLSKEDWKKITPNATSADDSKRIHNIIYPDTVIEERGGINGIKLTAVD